MTTAATSPFSSQTNHNKRRLFVEPLAFGLGMIAFWLWTVVIQQQQQQQELGYEAGEENVTALSSSSIIATTGHNDSIPPVLHDNKQPVTIYGHVHMAQTAGSNINGALAAQYERVCGSKGYSYDAYQFNLRVERQYQAQTADESPPLLITDLGGPNDLIRKAYPSKNGGGGIWNRGNVPLTVLDEIGYEDCDYISLEMDWQGWNTRFHNHHDDDNDDENWNLELHVPCRDPLAHLMALCRQEHPNTTFDCDAANLSDEIEKCLGGSNNESPLSSSHSPITNRFHADLNQTFALKCFEPIPVDNYLEYMGERLQPKQRPATYQYRFTTPANRHRPLAVSECIWDDQYAAVAEEVRRLLNDLPYFQWCRECLADPHRNLLFSKTTIMQE
ncbi:hypothetical protein ACA910_007654 [Epithemia clementina (nom. ined.)]